MSRERLMRIIQKINLIFKIYKKRQNLKSEVSPLIDISNNTILF